MKNILALETMKEGHDGSGLGLTLKDLGGEFKNLKKYPNSQASVQETAKAFMRK